MSQSRSSKVNKAMTKAHNGLQIIDNTTSLNSASLDENTFRNLKDKISAQLSGLDKKAEKKQGKRNQKQTEDNKSSRGKKRTLDGTVVGLQKSEDLKKNFRTTDAGVLQTDDEELRAALKELGGTEEDFNLIAEVDSESELEGADGEAIIEHKPRKKGSSSLQHGIENILKEIALANGGGTDGPTSSKGHGEEPGLKKQESGSGIDPENATFSEVTAASKSDEKKPSKKFGNKRFKCEPRADWFNISTAKFDDSVGAKYHPSQQIVEQLHTYAKSLLLTENEVFRTNQQVSSSQAFYNTIIASGTLSDKISALTLAVQESPIHNVKALENLVSLAGKRNRAQAIDVLRALKDLFAQGSLLPDNRRLFTFSTQPALLATISQVKSWSQDQKLPRGLQESDLICWAFEDWLKQQYFEILKILEGWCNDEIEFSKSRSISYIYELLKEKPEQESNLLRLLVNKLGDPVKKLASQTSYLLMQLLSAHPAMKMVVISVIEADFIFRPGQSMHGQYYAAVTLNQTALSMKEEGVARKLLNIYFGMFTSLLKPLSQDQDVNTTESQSRAQRKRKRKTKVPQKLQGEELREKLISAILTGVNRAYPYVGTDQKNFTDHLETLFKITHSANFNTSIQAMLLIQQLTSTHSVATDRFYRTLYESLLDPRLITASKQQLYLNLLHRSLKVDMNTKRVKAFVKRLLQILSLHEPSFICGVFFLLKDLEGTYPSLTALFDQAEDRENEEEVFRDVDEDAKMPDTRTPNENTSIKSYDGHKRAPEHANAENSCAWEVLPFLAHFHPSVSLSADHYMQHTKLPGKPDLSLHTLIHFLDRFVYRNPKLAANTLRGSSIMQPMVSEDTHAVLISSTSRQTAPAVNSEAFRSKKSVDVAAEDAFFHKYFTTLGRETKAKKRRDHKTEEDSSTRDEGEDEVWKAMMDSAPDLEGMGSEDDDMEMSDLEGEMSDEELFANMVDAESEQDDEEEVDIEAGIFDDSNDDLMKISNAAETGDQDSASDFGGLDSEVEEGDLKFEKKKDQRKAGKEQRKKMKALPTFASAADYAKMLEDDEDEDLG